jgi:DNA-binding response OmpR family regulator
VILVIEDDLITTHILTALLKRLRMDHVVAHTGAEALKLAADLPVDLIISDLMLPDMHGLDLIEQMIIKPWLQDIPVMFCTAEAHLKTVERALGMGAVDFVRKPINVDQMQARIERALQRAPKRWESWREMIKRLRVDGRSFYPLLQMARDELTKLLGVLDRWEPATGDLDQLNQSVQRLHGAAMNVGAVRCVQMIDFLWSGTGGVQDASDLRSALTIELRGFERAIANRSSGLASLSASAR